jgi:DNA mismatch repair protein MutH
VKSEASLLEACSQIEGMTLAQLALQLNLTVTELASSRKGWVGQAIERVLGAQAGSRPEPDFISLGIELKTLPINQQGKPAESTFVTSISLLNIEQQTWLTSVCWSKLKRVLWIPVEADASIPFLERRIGQAILWSPTPHQTVILERDWLELTNLIVLGKLGEIDAQMGEYLQIRPKAANGKSLSYAYDEEGRKQFTLPRGFYLRPALTGLIYDGR